MLFPNDHIWELAGEYHVGEEDHIKNGPVSLSVSGAQVVYFENTVPFILRCVPEILC